MTENEVAALVVEAAIQVHRRLGPGLFESVYHQILAYEIQRRGCVAVSKRRISVMYDGLVVPDAFEPDLIVQELVIVEIKSVESLAPVHKAQLLTYLKLTGLRLGLLVNFNVSFLKNGLKRVVNGLEREN